MEGEEQILDGQEDTGSLDEQIQKAEASLNWKNVEVLDQISQLRCMILMQMENQKFFV